jgi:two-component system, LytTR family, response regulator LytT
LNEQIRILIVEDELLIAEMLKEMLLDLDYAIVGIAKNYREAITLLEKKGSIDLCFVDINLGGEFSGFDVVKSIRETYFLPFVFLTSYSDKKTVAEAATFQPEAYLVKPFSQIDLLTTVEIIRSRKKTRSENPEPSAIVIKDGNLNVKLNSNDILWLKSENVYVEIKTVSKIYLVRNSLERFMEEINEPAFFRTHRSFAVNINLVTAVAGQFLIVAGEKIPLSRKFREKIRQHFHS